MSDSFQAFSHYKLSASEMILLPLSVEYAQQLCTWRYEPPYDLYNWPAWEDMQKDEIEFGDPVLRHNQYAAIVNKQAVLIGFAQFFPIVGVTRIGLGLLPELCGNGNGAVFAAFLAQEAGRRTPDNEIDLEVLTWNKRAIRAYEHAGFCIEDTYSRPVPSGPPEAEFHCMVYRPKSS